jgi:hypothetical protein
LHEHAPHGWVAFELSVLRRLRFRSVANPLAGEPDLDLYLKRWGARVAVNDPARWAWVRGLARVENNAESLTVEDFELLLEDVYVPRHRLQNPALRRWFGETDAWWFDNYRQNVERLAGEIKQALALDLGMMVGDYALSFDDETRELRRPLSRVLLRLNDRRPAPVDNRERNASTNRDARRFLSEAEADLLFVRLPPPTRERASAAASAWREEFVRGGADFWAEFATARAGWLGTHVETRQQYLRFVEELLDAATTTRFKTLAVSYAERGHLPAESIVEALRRTRKVDTVYTKDFSELAAARAVIITTAA